MYYFFTFSWYGSQFLFFTFNLTCETRCKGRQKNLEINYNLFFLLVSRVLVCVCTVPPLKPHLCSSSYIQSISPVFVLYKSLMHKAYQILDMPPPLSLSCSPSFSSSLTPSLSWWVWLIGDTWDECETWELSRSSEHQPPCRVSIPYCTVKMKSREKKKRYKDRNEKKGGAVRVWFTDTAEGWGLCVFSPRPARGISFKTDTDQWIRPFYVRQTLCWRTELLKQTSRYRSL